MNRFIQVRMTNYQGGKKTSEHDETSGEKSLLRGKKRFIPLNKESVLKNRQSSE